MNNKQKLWDWYKKHTNVINAFVDIGCGLIPSGNIVKNILGIGLAKTQWVR